MLNSTPRQFHGAYQRPTRWSLEVSEQELLSQPKIERGATHHLPQTLLPTPLSARLRSPEHCPMVETQGAMTLQVATLAHQCQLAEPAVQVDPLAQLHHRNIRKTLTRRLRAACERGDQALVYLLQQEAAQFA
ncbi:MAG: hypothetical protein AAGG51_20925 [Cyanobacteria bacterium P01_G01_bin.54]